VSSASNAQPLACNLLAAQSASPTRWTVGNMSEVAWGERKPLLPCSLSPSVNSLAMRHRALAGHLSAPSSRYGASASSGVLPCALLTIHYLGVTCCGAYSGALR
jgi:hypothetical protein